MKHKNPSIHPDSKVRNTLGAPPEVYTRLLSKLNGDIKDGYGSHSRRKHRRLELFEPYLDLSLSSREMSRKTIVVAVRNICRSGLSVLHSHYIYPGTKINAKLKRLDAKEQSVTGSVVRCDHRGGIVHEVGINFDTSIHPQEFIQYTPADAFRSLERVDRTEITGKLIIVGQDPAFIEPVREALNTSKLESTFFNDPAECLESEPDEDSIIVACLNMSPMSGPEFVINLRSGGFSAPVLLAGNAETRLDLGCIQLSTADTFIPLPFDADDFFKAIGEYTLFKWSIESLECARSHKDPEAMSNLRNETAKLAVLLDQQNRTHNAQGVRSICQTISSISPMLGSLALSDYARQIVSAIGANPDLAPVQDQIQDIRMICSNIRNAA